MPPPHKTYTGKGNERTPIRKYYVKLAYKANNRI